MALCLVSECQGVSVPARLPDQVSGSPPTRLHRGVGAWVPESVVPEGKKPSLLSTFRPNPRPLPATHAPRQQAQRPQTAKSTPSIPRCPALSANEVSALPHARILPLRFSLALPPSAPPLCLCNCASAWSQPPRSLVGQRARQGGAHSAPHTQRSRQTIGRKARDLVCQIERDTRVAWPRALLQSCSLWKQSETGSLGVAGRCVFKAFGRDGLRLVAVEGSARAFSVVPRGSLFLSECCVETLRCEAGSRKGG